MSRAFFQGKRLRLYQALRLTAIMVLIAMAVVGQATPAYAATNQNDCAWVQVTPDNKTVGSGGGVVQFSAQGKSLCWWYSHPSLSYSGPWGGTFSPPGGDWTDAVRTLSISVPAGVAAGTYGFTVTADVHGGYPTVSVSASITVLPDPP